MILLLLLLTTWHWSSPDLNLQWDASEPSAVSYIVVEEYPQNTLNDHRDTTAVSSTVVPQAHIKLKWMRPTKIYVVPIGFNAWSYLGQRSESSDTYIWDTVELKISRQSSYAKLSWEDAPSTMTLLWTEDLMDTWMVMAIIPPNYSGWVLDEMDIKHKFYKLETK